jgi:hypothetical protein
VAAHAGVDGSAPCAIPELVPAQGPSCRLPNGLWSVLLKDGSTYTTHGPDMAPSHLTGFDFAAAPIPPVCTTRLDEDYYGHVVYALPSDGPDEHARLAPYIRRAVELANGRLRQDSAMLQQRRDYRMACDAAGNLRIDRVRLATPAADAHAGTIVGDLRQLGYTNTHAKYWVWYDGSGNCPTGTCLGQAEFRSDDRLIAGNASNTGPMFAIVYGLETDYATFTAGGESTGILEGVTAYAFMHETGHTMGAVQLSAPHTTKAAHCTDGDDILCYVDSGSQGNQYRDTACPGYDFFDCGNDDYFDPRPSPSGYLSNHWNLGSTLNRFLVAGQLP